MLCIFDIKESYGFWKPTSYEKYANKMTDLLEEFHKRLSDIQTYSEATEIFLSFQH
jgi:hypothetical protein